MTKLAYYHDESNSLYKFSLPTQNVIRAGMYEFQPDPGSARGLSLLTAPMVFHKQIVDRENDPNDRMINSCKNFLEGKALYEKLGIPHKRGFYIHGGSGCGKTTVLYAVAESLIRSLDAIVINTNNCSPDHIIDGILNIRSVEPDRMIGILIEDIDKKVHIDGLDLYTVLFDGLYSFSNVVTFATAVTPPDLVEKELTRSGRFDEYILVDLPTENDITKYITKLYSQLPKSAVKNLPLNSILAPIICSKNLSYAALQEIMSLILIYKMNPPTAINKFNEKRKIGF